MEWIVFFNQIPVLCVILEHQGSCITHVHLLSTYIQASSRWLLDLLQICGVQSLLVPSNLIHMYGWMGGDRTNPEKGQFCPRSHILTFMDLIMNQIKPDGGDREDGGGGKCFKNSPLFSVPLASFPFISASSLGHSFSCVCKCLRGIWEEKRVEAAQTFFLLNYPSLRSHAIAQ